MADEHDIGGSSGGPPAAAPAPKQVSPRGGGGEQPPEGAAYGQRHVDEYRRRIDQIDEQLMKLLNARSACAVEIGRIKRRLGMPVYQPDREKWILDRVARNNPGPLDPGAVRRVFERVIDESRRLERLAGEAEVGAEGATRQEGD
ncbi:MAG TPA: chorismate mutase [Vicinamibacteria bacterium]|nr:chorismate mutase [Vicinamibacteria bacterium]